MVGLSHSVPNQLYEPLAHARHDDDFGPGVYSRGAYASPQSHSHNHMIGNGSERAFELKTGSTK